MARRSKAASRRARQKRRGREPRRPIPPAPRPTPAPSEPASPTAAIDEPRLARGSRFDPRTTLAGPSALDARARAEYAYVLRELRSIVLLVVLMIVVLLAAWIGFGLVGIGPG
jgi:hypothetical protein